MAAPATPSQVHNAAATAALRAIAMPVLAANGELHDIMVVTESVLVGVAMTCIRLGGDDAVLDLMVAAAKERLALLRLADLPTQGAA